LDSGENVLNSARSGDGAWQGWPDTCHAQCPTSPARPPDPRAIRGHGRALGRGGARAQAERGWAGRTGGCDRGRQRRRSGSAAVGGAGGWSVSRTRPGSRDRESGFSTVSVGLGRHRPDRGLRPSDRADRRRSRVTVDAREHRPIRGVGRALTAHALEQLRAAGCTPAVVATSGDPGHPPERGLYEAAGFTALPLVRYYRTITTPENRPTDPGD
jgi:GNAT superfamily N-acetyltransferase